MKTYRSQELENSTKRARADRSVHQTLEKHCEFASGNTSKSTVVYIE